MDPLAFITEVVPNNCEAVPATGSADENTLLVEARAEGVGRGG